MGDVGRRGSVVGLLVLLLAAALAGCGSEPVEVAIEGAPAEAVARAAGRIEGTVRFRVHATVNAEFFVITQVAEGIVEPDGDSHVTTTTGLEYAEGYEDLGGAGTLGALGGTTEIISTGGVVYTRSSEEDPPAGRRPLPPGVEWVANDPGPTGSVAIDASGYLEPLGILDDLREVTEVEDRGTAEVDDEPIRWLRAVVPEDAGDGSVVPPGTTVDVALTAEGLVRRVAFASQGEDGMRIRVIADYYEHDVEATVEPPPADATIDQRELYGSEQPTP